MNDAEDHHHPRTLRERLGWRLIGADPEKVAEKIQDAYWETGQAVRPEKPHAKDRAQMALYDAAKELGLKEDDGDGI